MASSLIDYDLAEINHRLINQCLEHYGND